MKKIMSLAPVLAMLAMAVFATAACSTAVAPSMTGSPAASAPASPAAVAPSVETPATVGNGTLRSSDFKIIPPDPSVPAELARFSGKWEGRWSNILDHTLVVEKIKGNMAVVVYTWGRAPSWFTHGPGWQRLEGQFKSGELVLSLPSGATVTYSFKNGVMFGSYDRGRISARTMMKRSN